VNTRGGSSSSFDTNDVRKVNVVISLRLGKKADTHVGEQDVTDSPFPSSSLPYPQGDEIYPSPMIQILSEDVDGPKESKSVHDSTSPKDPLTPSTGVTRPPPPFPNQLKGKKVQSYVDKIRKTFSQVKINILLLDVIQQMPPYAHFLKDLCTTKRATNVSEKAFSASNVSSIISNQVPIKCKDLGCPTILIVISHHNIH